MDNAASRRGGGTGVAAKGYRADLTSCDLATNGEFHGLGSCCRKRKQVKGKVKEKWGKLTDDDLNVIDGRRDQLEGKIQERYGHAKDQVRKDIDDWYSSQQW
jgi:uncharacterized protein YjbJ (UPF0337 family)